MESSQHRQTAASTKTTRRYWRRRSEPVSGWWPWGLLPLIGLGLLYLFGIFNTASNIEKDVTSQVSSQLSDLGVSVIETQASGQELKVIANSTQYNQAMLESVAQGTLCNTWAGDKVCPTKVNIELAQASSTPAPKPLETKIKNRLHNFSFQRQGNSVTLNGEVPSQVIRNSINTAAKMNFNQVIDNLKVSNELATESYPLAYTQALNSLSKLRTGNARWQEGIFSLTGQVNSEDEALARSAFSQQPAPKLGDINLSVVKSVNTCNSEFQSLLKTSTINFRTNSAEINPNSQNLINQLAALAKKCPGNLQVEGHTDSVGSETYNQTLSQNRAESVRTAFAQLQVNSQRVKAIGYGESQPVADNTTPEGRAQNRRIVIKIAP